MQSSLRRAFRRCPPFLAARTTSPYSESPSPAPAPAAEAVVAMPTKPWAEALDATQRAFCLPLAGRVLAAAGGGRNAAVSPISVHAALALAAAGARGATLDQLLAVLGAGGGVADAANVSSRVVRRVLKDRSTSGGPRVAFAGGLWADASVALQPAFAEAAANVYSAATKAADFQNEPEEARQQINSWVSDATRHVIESFIPADSVDQTTSLILGNVLYFRGKWLETSDIRHTTEEKFYRLDGSSVQVPFMEYDRTRLFAAYDGFRIIRLPYKQGKNERKFAMYVFLPDAPDGLFGLTEKITTDPTFLDQHLPTEKRHVGIRIPKFTISYQIDAKDFLKEMGLELPFCDDADFSDMFKKDNPNRLLYLSGVFHRAFVEVNEKGIEAAAVTMGTMPRDTSKPAPVERFIADHPFLFVIREDVSGTIVVMGHVLDPAL